MFLRYDAAGAVIWVSFTLVAGFSLGPQLGALHATLVLVSQRATVAITVTALAVVASLLPTQSEQHRSCDGVERDSCRAETLRGAPEGSPAPPLPC